MVRSDAARVQTGLCRPCASRKSLARAPRRAKRGTTVACSACGRLFYRVPSEANRRYCSHACASDAKRQTEPENRTCACCGTSFRYTPRLHSNSAGRYCSLDCRDRGYLGVVHGDAERPAVSDRRGWRSRRDRFVAQGNDFCAVCGSRERVEVHHIEGYRNVPEGMEPILAAVCTRHHRMLEAWTTRIAGLGAEARRHAATVILGCLGDSWCLHSGRALLAGGGSCK